MLVCRACSYASPSLISLSLHLLIPSSPHLLTVELARVQASTCVREDFLLIILTGLLILVYAVVGFLPLETTEVPIPVKMALLLHAGDAAASPTGSCK